MKLDPNILNVIGLLFGIVGGIYLSIDALAPDGLIEALEDAENHKSKLTSVSFVFAIRKIFSILLITLAGFLLVKNCIINDLTASLALATFSYPTFKIITKICQFGFELTRRVSPAKGFSEAKLFMQIIRLTLMLPWFILLTLFLIICQSVHYLISKPIEVISTYLFGGLTFRLLKSAAKTSKIEKEYSFRRRSFFGVMFLCLGFIYQLFATVVMLCAPH